MPAAASDRPQPILRAGSPSRGIAPAARCRPVHGMIPRAACRRADLGLGEPAMKSLRIVIALLIVLVGGGAAIVLSGAIDVAATAPDPGFVKAILENARDRSIE